MSKLPEIGTEVRTAPSIMENFGVVCATVLPIHHENRRSDSPGIYKGSVTDDDDSVVWVEHNEGIAVYAAHEISWVELPYTK